LESLAVPGGDGTVPDRDLVLALTPDKAEVLADRFQRVRKTLGKGKKKARFNAVLTVTTDNLAEAQPAIETVLDRTTKRWKLDEVVTNTGKPSEIYYIVRLRRTVTRDELLTAIQDHAGSVIESADLEIAEPADDKAAAKA